MATLDIDSENKKGQLRIDRRLIQSIRSSRLKQPSCRFSSGGKEYSVRGEVAGTMVAGVVDTGAERSCVSPEFSRAH